MTDLLEPMEQAGDVASGMDNLKNIAAKAWPDGKIVGACVRCNQVWDYGWDDVVHMMTYGMPRHCDQRIDLR